MMEDRTRLFLIRHGETTTAWEFRYIGHRDVDITKKGIQQMNKLRNRFKEIDISVLYCSDLMRTMKGAKIIASCHPIEPVAFKEFREINLGVWEGLTREEIIERYPLEYEQRLKDLANYRIKGGESFKDLQVRVVKKLSELLNRSKGKNLVLLAHGGVNRAILFDILNLDLQLLPRIEQEYGCLNIIDYYDDGPVIKLING